MIRAMRIPLAALLAVALLSSCATPRGPIVVFEPAAMPEPAEVDQVLFLVGDPGQARTVNYPIMPRLQQDIEAWSERLADSAVTVLVLGDIVYPLGLHPPGHELFPHDSAIVMDQVRLLAGPAATSRKARGYFMAGNHDWGLEEDWEGFVRLKTLDDFLGVARAQTGAQAFLVPEAGTGGPFVVDLGEHVRLLILDTAWWLLDTAAGGDENRAEVLRKVEEAINTAGRREILFAAHHPFKTVGPHGTGGGSFWTTLGVRYLLTRSGAILQDLTSVPYRELARGLREIFERTGPPLAFIGGHEHSLQLIGAVNDTDPTYSIVSGSASKVTTVGTLPGVRFAQSAPGYMRLFVLKNGGLRLFVEASPVELRTCPTAEPQRAECMARGVASFETVYSQRLR